MPRHLTIETMALCWWSALKSSRPPDISSFFPTTGARRVLASNKNTFCELSHHPCNSSLSHPGRLVLVIIEVEGVSEVAVVWLCPILGYFFYRISQEMASPVMIVSLVVKCPEGRRNSFSRCKKRTCDVLASVCSFGIEFYLSGCIMFIPIWE